MTKEDKIIDDYFNKNIEYDKRDVYQAIVNRVADLEFENEMLKSKRRNGGTYECFHCLHDSVVWQSDFDYEDYGYMGEGIVQILHCSNCGADIEYDVPVVAEELDE